MWLWDAQGIFPVFQLSRSQLLLNPLMAVLSLGLASESVPSGALTLASGKSILDSGKGLPGTSPGLLLLPAHSWYHRQGPKILPALGKAPAQC